ncbi:MAG: helix-turn-helix domain-containing protein [Streptosporangiaceae bacterium]|jgi:AraC-like DNA-binding protein
MASRHVPLGGDEWRAALASNFNGLIPDRPSAPDTANAMGRLAAAQLGDVTAFHVAGNSQVLRRSDAWARRLPSDLLKVCIQRAGSATIEQGGREVTLTPGSMAIYDIDRPYGIRLDGEWRCSVIAFPRHALVASRQFLDAVMCRPTPISDGPGSVLIPLVASAISSMNGTGPAGGTSHVLMGRASLDLLKAALASRNLAERPDTVRLQVDTYIQAHLSDAGLGHRTVAEAFHMSDRTLHRLFGESGQTVTARIRSYRLERILADLRSPGSADDSISRIAARWGVHDMPHLVRAFRARYGMTPSEARWQSHDDSAGPR